MNKLIIFLSVMIMSCHSSKSVEKTKENTNLNPVKYSIILNSAMYGNGDEGIKEGEQIIKSKEEWYALTKKMNSVNSVTSSIRVAPEFDKYFFVAVFDKIVGSSGQAIGVKKVEENNKNIFITIAKKRNNDENLVGSAVMNQPFVIFRIPKTDKKIVFKY